jgi:putative transferase (TIGR04331 family)
MKRCKKISFGPRGKEFEVYGLSNYVESVSFPLWIGNRSKRQRLNSIAENEPNIFLKNVLLQMPLYHVEGFSMILEKVPKLEHPEAYEFHFEHGDSFFMEMLVAYYVEYGARAIMYQLGAFIGEVDYLTINPVMYAKIDEHRTYGWKINEKDVPHAAYRLEEFSKLCSSYKESEKYDILIVYNNNAVEKEIFAQYKINSHYLFENLKAIQSKKLLLRPRGKSKKLDSSKDLLMMNPPSNSEIDKGMAPLAQLVAMSKLVIHWEVPATNFLECIYIDKPVVGIIQNIDPTEFVMPHYNNLKRLGILHDDVFSLVHHLNNCDWNKWWEEVIVNPHYLLFKNTFTKKP